MKDQAKARGCQCDECPLKNQPGPVFSEPRPVGTPLALIGEFPGDMEVSEGRPFVGPQGKLLAKVLKKANLDRNRTYMTLAVLCQPPANDMKKLLARLRSENAAKKRENTKRGKQGLPPIPLVPNPVDCCRPRLVAEIAEFPYLMPLGGLAAGTVLGGTPAIDPIRGSLMDGSLIYDAERNVMGLTDPSVPGHPIRMIPSLSLARIRKQPKWLETFQGDFERMGRWMTGHLRWTPPQEAYHPSAEALYAFLASGQPAYTFDVETDGIAALSCNIRCISIGTPTHVMCIGTRPKDMDRSIRGDSGFYPPAEMERVKEVLRWFFLNPAILKVGHNAGYYDRLVIRQWLGIDPHPILDTILLHRLAESELPHSLGFVGSKYTDIHAWKANRAGKKLATDAESDHELHHYCNLDVAVTARVLAPVWAEVNKVQQQTLVEKDHLVQNICADMHTVGMFVDQALRKKTEDDLIRSIVKARKQLQNMSFSDFNPGSTQQLRKILFDDWKLTPPLEEELRYTETGDPSTSDNILRSLLSLDHLPDHPRQFIIGVRTIRKLLKQLGTYVAKLRPMSEVIPAGMGFDADEEEDIRKEREERGYEKRGIVWLDGRMRPGYNAHVALTGRLSSSSPINAQNFPKHLRKLIIPQPGHVLVGADADQIELRIAAARWQLQRYIDALNEGIDPHSMVTARAIFGDVFMNCKGWPSPENGNKWTGDAYDYRQLAKIIQYAFQYKASVETGTRIIQSTEVEDKETGRTRLPYVKKGVREVRQMREAWLQGVPELERGWDREIAHFRQYGYVQEPVHGRRRFCKDGENPNEIVNFPIQGSASALMNNAMIGIWRDIPLHKWGPGTGLLTQTHDALVVECPAAEANWVKSVIEHHMNQSHPSLPGVRFTATADIGCNWKDVG